MNSKTFKFRGKTYTFNSEVLINNLSKLAIILFIAWIAISTLEVWIQVDKSFDGNVVNYSGWNFWTLFRFFK